jgi:predicted nucleotide-binding protein
MIFLLRLGSGMYKKIENFIKQADEYNEEWQIKTWQQRVGVFLREAVGGEAEGKFSHLSVGNLFEGFSRQIGYLEALLVRAEKEERYEVIEQSGKRKINLSNKKVFIVHGHDNEAKETVSRFVEKIGLEALILHEQANRGQTVIEKFETHSDVIFSVILLTPDDKGAAITELENMKFRARQNVVLELGYFLGALGRKRVCALYKGDIEIPTDIQGILYIKMDSEGAWKNKLAQEFVHAHIEIKLEGLLTSPFNLEA